MPPWSEQPPKRGVFARPTTKEEVLLLTKSAAPQARSMPCSHRNRHPRRLLTRPEQSALRQWTYSLLVGMPGAERRACPTRARSGAAGASIRGPRSPRSNHEISTEKRPRLTRGNKRDREWHELRPSFDRLLTELSPRLKTPPEKRQSLARATTEIRPAIARVSTEAKCHPQCDREWHEFCPTLDRQVTEK